jgi:hypothetical protein
VRKTYSLPTLLTGLIMLAAPAVSSAGIALSITVAPPALPVYVQPPCPVDGYLWNPGYWAYGNAGYYWVPGVWVAPPQVGLLWTPPWWGFVGGVYTFNAGYWGPQVGFYGGINYGFGYAGVGFFGGEWRGGHFAYNTVVTHVNTTVIHNTYRSVVNRTAMNNSRASFNGSGGVNARPTAQEAAAARERHVQPTSEQVAHERSASADRGQLASVNHGRPATMAAARPMAVSARTNSSPANNRVVGNVSRPASAPRAATEQRREVTASRPANEQRRPATASRPATEQQREVTASRPASASRPAPEPRAASAPHPASAPRPAPETRAAAAPHPAAPKHGG